MTERKYRIDGRPVTASELIDTAAAVNADFANDWLKCTSVAARILREEGCFVDDNPDYSSAMMED